MDKLGEGEYSKVIRNTAMIDKDPENPENPEEPTEETETTVNKANVSIRKESVPARGSEVSKGEEITYKITVDNSQGTAPGEVIVKDSIPEGTTFVEGSIKVGEELQEGLTADNLASGILVSLNAGETKVVEFKVTVGDLENGTIIRNQAVMDTDPEDPSNPEVPTEETENTYVEPVFNANKTFTTENSQSYVVEGEKITYTITVNNTGDKAGEVIVKDNIPEGTSFVENSIKINDMATVNTEENLRNGIRVIVDKKSSTRVSFEVMVGDLENRTIIRNQAVIDTESENPENPETPTNETETEYVEPEISSRKSTLTERGKDYVIAGEEITYTITVNNMGGLAEEVLVKDSIPEGTTFVEGSIEVGDRKTEKTAEELAEGIIVRVEANESNTVKFKVIVNKDMTGKIKNIARIKEDPDNPEVPEEETNEEETEVVSYEKEAIIERKTEEEIEEGRVTAGDEIRYVIRVRGSGEVKDRIEIEDEVPEGTTLIEIGEEGKEVEKNKIRWELEGIGEGETKEVSFRVRVNYQETGSKIKNVGYVEGGPTNETETEVEKPEGKIESSIKKEGTKEITSKGGKVYYEIEYETNIREYVGNAKIIIVDKLPYEIDEKASELNGGKYDEETKTITWEEEIKGIDTYKETNGTKNIIKNKTISVQYKYPNMNEESKNMVNKVEGIIRLEGTGQEEKVEAETGTKVSIPAKVIVHHYIYDEETNTYTDTKLTEDEIKEGIVGDAYETKKSEKVSKNYECINEEPEGYKGNMQEEEIEVIYYYKLKEEKIANKIEKIAKASKTEEREEEITNEKGETEIKKTQVEVLTKEDGEITYTIRYKVKVNSYKGKIKVRIVDTLPYEIDEEASDIGGGTYDKATRTITWEEEIEGIDTFSKGTYERTIEKIIKVVYKGQDVTKPIVNTVKGSIVTYYPEGHTSKPGEEKKKEEIETSSTVEQEYKVNKRVRKEWEDDNNAKGKRPESVTVDLTQNGRIVENTTRVLSEENNWETEYSNLEKYNEVGQEYVYSVKERETNAGDLEYYEEAEIEGKDNMVVINRYRLMPSDVGAEIEKTGPEKITGSKEELKYTISYKAVVKEYIGKAEVIIKDEMPYEIDEEKSDLGGGTYDKETRTITWRETIEHINTYKQGDYEEKISKEIKIVYKGMDAKGKEIKNKAKGRINLYETEKTNEVEDEYTSPIEIKGKVKVKYVDKETGEEIKTVNDSGEETSYGYEIEGKVGDTYITERKEVPGYTYE